MSRSGGNKFIRATRHLKSTQIDERLQMLSEVPVNSTSSIYTDLDVTPTPVEVEIQIPGDVSRAADFDQDDSGTDTTGLFDDDGTILTVEPPGDTSAVLGPMISQWYSWGNFTRIGYVRQSDRRVVTLATIDGEIADYNEGESGNSLKTGITNSLTQEQVEWFRDQDKRTYYAFYPGPPTGGSDASGRYPGLIIATSKDVYSTGTRTDQRRDPVGIPQEWPNPDEGKAGNDLINELVILGISVALAKALIAALGYAKAVAVARSAAALRRFLEWWNKGRDGTVPGENTASWRTLKKDDLDQGAKFVNPKTGKLEGGAWPTNLRQLGDFMTGKGGFTWSINPFPGGGLSTGPTALTRQLVERPFRQIIKLFQSYEMEGQVISEEVDEMPSELMDLLDKAIIEMGGDIEKIGKLADFLEKFAKENGGSVKESVKESREVLAESRKRILREIKKPYHNKEEKKEKLKGYRPRVFGTPGTPIDNPMKKIECPPSFKPMEEKMWGKYEKRQNARASQERLNQVGEYVLEGGLFWEFLNKKENTRKSKSILEFYGEMPPKKIVRRENVGNDSIMFLVDQNGKTETLLQSEYNEMIDDQINKQLFAKYLEEQENTKDPLFKRVSQKINPAFDYENRPSKDGYPNTPPPEMVNGYHPDLVDGKKVADRFNRLDPISAEAMPPTGNPHIDVKVQKARRIKKILGKRG